MSAKICVAITLLCFSRIALAVTYICSGDYTVTLNGGEPRGQFKADLYMIDYRGGRSAEVTQNLSSKKMSTKIEDVRISGSTISGAKSQNYSDDPSKFVRIQFALDRDAMTAQINFDIGRAGKAYETTFSGVCR